MRPWILLGITAVCACVLLTGATQVQYEGHRVYRLTPQSQEQLEELVKFLEEHQELDVWQEPRGVGEPIEVVLPKGQSPDFLDSLSSKGMEQKLIIPDLLRKIKEHQFLNDIARAEETDMFQGYHQYTEIVGWLEGVAHQCGSMCELLDIGYSSEGRPLRVIKIGVEARNKPAVWIDGGIHAREWIAPATAMYFIERIKENIKAPRHWPLCVEFTGDRYKWPVTRKKLINDYPVDPLVTSMVDTYTFHILPMVNPDGYSYTWTTDRTWRKTRSRDNRTECVGVDANRNFDFKWKEYSDKANSNPCSFTFAGFEPFSEPEARAQAHYILNERDPWKVFLTLHSYGQLWMAPWGYTTDPPPDYDKMMSAGQAAVEALESAYGTNYTLGSASHILYQSSGTSRDWAKGVPQIEYVYTVELRDKGIHGFFLPPEYILPTATETWMGLRALMEHILLYDSFAS